MFIIRHRPTMQYMPQLDRRGYTWWMPEDYKGIKVIPRLFRTLTAAKNARNAWVKGCLERTYTQVGAPWDGGDSIEDLKISTTYGLGRKLEDLDILAVSLTIFAKPL